MKVFVALALILVGASASAQVGRPEHARAIAAGYKAAFLCSNLFNAGMSEAETVADDLRGTYPEYVPLFASLPAEIERTERRVTVRYSPEMPPRVAAWRAYLGCSLLPIGARVADSALLPRLAADPPEFGAFDARAWPMGDGRATARPRGDLRALSRALANAFDRRTYAQGSETTAVLIVQDERIVAERYRSDFDMHRSQRTWSVAKSIAGTVIGAAVQQGLIRTDQAAPVPEWQRPGDPRRAITFDHLMRMASGLHSDFPGNRTDDLYFGGVAVADQIAAWPLVAPPGTRFRYANNDTLAAVRALQHVLGDGDESRLFPFRALFWRIGMTRTVPETDWRGHFIMSSQVWTTARDLARLGLLHLNDGVWQGERILPAGWRDHVGRRGPAQPAAGEGYGATWWTFAADSGLPQDAIVAQGNRGQYLAVIPRAGWSSSAAASTAPARASISMPSRAKFSRPFAERTEQAARCVIVGRTAPSQRQGTAMYQGNPDASANFQAQLMFWLPRILGAIAILVVAWILARMAKWAIAKVVDRVPALKRHYETEPGKTLGSLIGDVVFWLILLIGIMLALQPLRLTQVMEPVQRLTNNAFSFIPNIIGAALIFIIGLVVAKIVRRLVEGALLAANADGWMRRAGLAETGTSPPASVAGEPADVTTAAPRSSISRSVATLVFYLIMIPVSIAALQALRIDAISGPATQMLNTIAQSIPNVLGALILLGIGYVIGKLAKGAIEQLLPSMGFDRSVGALGFSSGGMAPSRVVGSAVMIAILLFFAVKAAELLGSPIIAVMLAQVLELGGQVLFGTIIILAGVVIARVVSGLVSGAEGSGWLPAMVRWSIIALAVAMGLRFMGLANEIVIIAFTAILGSAAVACALAFGLGGRPTAHKLLERWTEANAVPIAPKPPRAPQPATTSAPDDSQPPLV